MQDVHETRGSPPASLRALIERVQWMRRLALSATVLSAVMITLSYLLLIWPIFQPHDLSNSRVQQFLLSEEFRARTAPLFAQMQRYNASSEGSPVERPDEFYAGSGSMSGLQVVVHYLVVARGQGAADHVRASYVPDIDVRLDPRYLIFYLALMAGAAVLLLFILRPASKPQRQFEQRLLERSYADPAPAVDDASTPGGDLAQLFNLLQNFHAFVRQIGKRHAKRTAMTFVDEYDVQDALHALLKLHYLHVRAEEYTPSYAGNSSRMDFRLDDNEVAIEVKMTRDGLRDREIVDQLVIDAARYSQHPGVKRLVCLIYDPAGLLDNPAVLKKDLESGRLGLRVNVVIAPQHA
ncbi:hypothetical protein ACM9XD_08555 [Xanthomonas sacchari]